MTRSSEVMDPGLVLWPVESQARLSLPPETCVVRRARQFVVAHVPPLADEVVDALLLLTSELVTNAVIHARTPLEVTVTVGAEHVVVAVHDLGTDHPDSTRDDASVGRDGGWGLGLVASLADATALTRHEGGGRTAWFRLRRVLGAQPA